jgi:hypothetical protein
MQLAITAQHFNVADTVFAEAKAKGYTREQWEDALEKAEQRTLEKAEQRTSLMNGL